MPIVAATECHVPGCVRKAGAVRTYTLRNGTWPTRVCTVHRGRINDAPDRWGGQFDPLDASVLPLVRCYGADPDTGGYWNEPRAL